MWRLEVQCEGAVRDPFRLAAPALANHAARPGRAGMEAGASQRPSRPTYQSTGGLGKENGGSESPDSG
jgi:hypothetical protein